MAARFHRPLKVIEFNAKTFRNGAMSSVNRFRTHIDVALLSGTHLNPMRGSSFEIISFIGLAASREGKAALTV
jgi:hypothetical protein